MQYQYRYQGHLGYCVPLDRRDQICHQFQQVRSIVQLYSSAVVSMLGLLDNWEALKKSALKLNLWHSTVATVKIIRYPVILHVQEEKGYLKYMYMY